MEQSEIDAWARMAIVAQQHERLWLRTRTWNTAVRYEGDNAFWAISIDGHFWLLVGSVDNPLHSEEESELILSTESHSHSGVRTDVEIFDDGYTVRRIVMPAQGWASLEEMMMNVPPPSLALMADARAYMESRQIAADGGEAFDMDQFNRLSLLYKKQYEQEKKNSS